MRKTEKIYIIYNMIKIKESELDTKAMNKIDVLEQKSNDYADKLNTNTTDKEKDDILIKAILLHMFRNN